MGYEFEVIPADIDETVYPGADPAGEAVRLAVAKAEEVAARLARGRHRSRHPLRA
jgi:predicted house-cleaning NTP pyrophosphatase (Maf/HAM1 superfamily)